MIPHAAEQFLAELTYVTEEQTVPKSPIR